MKSEKGLTRTVRGTSDDEETVTKRTSECGYVSSGSTTSKVLKFSTQSVHRIYRHRFNAASARLGDGSNVQLGRAELICSPVVYALDLFPT